MRTIPITQFDAKSMSGRGLRQNYRVALLHVSLLTRLAAFNGIAGSAGGNGMM